MLALAVAAQGLYLRATTLSFWSGPGYSPRLETGLLISNITSAVLLILGIVMSVWALLLLIGGNAWLIIGPVGLIVVITLVWRL